LEPLTERETSILQLLIDGLTYAEIGRRLVISVNTVRYHIKSLYGKLRVVSRRQAITRAHEWGYAASSR
jgi:LuxR family maltose regulon positive regulatory protein